MRTTLDLPDSLMRELKTRAALNGQSLKSLLNDLIQRGMRLPVTAELAQPTASSLPLLKRLQNELPLSAEATPLNNQDLADLTLQADIEKLQRIGFIR